MFVILNNSQNMKFGCLDYFTKYFCHILNNYETFKFWSLIL